MDESIVERLARLEGQTKTSQNTRRKPLAVMIALGSAILLIGIGLLLWKQTHNSDSPLPNTVVQATSYPVYYPTTLPKGYQYKQDSATTDGTTTMYILESGSQNITITMQELPKKQKLLLNKTPGLTPIITDSGEAYAGTFNGRPGVIIQTDQTLVSITGDGTNIPQGALNAIAKNLAEVKR